MFDSKCYELSEYFLSQAAPDALKTELAEWIQQHVDVWLYDETIAGRKRWLQAQEWPTGDT